MTRCLIHKKSPVIMASNKNFNSPDAVYSPFFANSRQLPLGLQSMNNDEPKERATFFAAFSF